jgi:hypothetical protein
MNKLISKIFFIALFFLSLNITSLKAEGYIFGGPKIFYYDISQSDVDKTATDLVALGFSSAKVTANNSGIGFDIGVGFPTNNKIDIEASFVYMGEFELKADLTGPVETLTATSSAWTIPIVGKFKVGDNKNNFFVKGGFHFWEQNSEISTSLGKVTMWGDGFDPVIGVGGQVGGLLVSYEHYSFSGIGAGAGIGDGGMSALSLTWKSEF